MNEQKVRNYYFRELYTFIFMSFNKFMAVVDIYRIQSNTRGRIGLLPRRRMDITPIHRLDLRILGGAVGVSVEAGCHILD